MQKAYRMRKNGQFNFVFHKGKKAGSRLLSLVYVKTGKLLVGFAVNKKVGHAVVRNRVKRCLRESFRTQIPYLKNGYYVFVAHPEAANATCRELNQCMNKLLERHQLYKPE